MTADPTAMVVAAPEVHCGRVDGAMVLFSQRERRLHILNSSAAHVWSLLDRPVRIDDVIDQIADTFDTAPSEIRSDVLPLLRQLLDAGLCNDPSDSSTSPLVPVSAASIDDIGLTRSQPIGPLRAIGVPMVIEADDELLAAELARILEPLIAHDVDFNDEEDVGRLQLIVAKVSEHGWCVYRNGEVVGTPQTREGALRAVLAQCNAAPVDVLDDAVVLHAAGSDLGTGVVVFPGVSNAGKSTLVTQLTERGHRYLTDEAVAIDLASLQARPFPKSICLETGSQIVVPHLAPTSGISATWDVDPRSVGPGRLSDGGVICAVVFPTFDPTAPASLQPLEPFEMFRLLLANSFDFARMGQRAFTALVRVANAVPGYALTHSGGARHLEQLETLFVQERVVSL